MAQVAMITPICADERPSRRNIALAGLAMGLPSYAMGLVLHEGSHALAARSLGAEVTDFNVMPGRHPVTGNFFFGYVTVQGLRTTGDLAWFLLAPKVTNVLLLGGFSALYSTGSLPASEYGRTALLVLATGFWIDFSKDIVAFSRYNDTVKVYRMLGLDSEYKRLPARLLHLGVSAMLGYALYQGYEELLTQRSGAETQTMIIPLWDNRF